jgi:hypothetical protein
MIGNQAIAKKAADVIRDRVLISEGDAGREEGDFAIPLHGIAVKATEVAFPNLLDGNHYMLQ